jgi:hypothetical protein
MACVGGGFWFPRTRGNWEGLEEVGGTYPFAASGT